MHVAGLLQPAFREIKRPEERNNNSVNQAALRRTNLPAAPCTPPLQLSGD